MITCAFVGSGSGFHVSQPRSSDSFKMALLFLMFVVGTFAADVKVDIRVSRPNNPAVQLNKRYLSHVTLSIENDDGSLTPSGWSTRKV